MKNIAIFISGKGSNASRMIEAFSTHDKIQVVVLISSKPNEAILDLCEKHKVRFLETSWEAQDHEKILQVLKNNTIQWLVLAGFLKKIPSSLISVFPNRIINLHPSLLPKFGGKGMYGMHVHNAVIASKEIESGISIHYVNEAYDEGQIIQQYKVQINPDDDANSLFESIRDLETKYFISAVENEILKNRD